jgi:hypothetical protein
MPASLKVLGVAGVIAVIAWVFLVPGHWTRGFAVIGILLIIALISEKLHRRYEQTGQAVKLPQRRRRMIVFSKGLPGPMLAARLAFFLTVAVMLVLGWAPVGTSTAHHGIIACVFALIIVAVLNLSIEHHYVKAGKATEVDD